MCPGFTTRSAARIPVYCLLIGFDKEDAIRIAREIGTFEQSTSQASGCTAVPEGPSTKAKPERNPGNREHAGSNRDTAAGLSLTLTNGFGVSLQ
ncbi:MAG: hypothetical protein LUO90_04215 [Methanoregula sp.]|nr:hypothetical protein [Methanoregula sp.]